MAWLSILVAVAILAAAAWILIRRIVAFVKSGGQSGCENCPYASGCDHKGSCEKKKM